MGIKSANRGRINPPKKPLKIALDPHSNPNEVQVPPAEDGTFKQGNPERQEVLKEKKSFGKLVDEAYERLGVDLKPEA